MALGEVAGSHYHDNATTLSFWLQVAKDNDGNDIIRQCRNLKKGYTIEIQF